MLSVSQQGGGPHLQLHEALCYVGNARYMEVYVDLEGEDPRKFCCGYNGQRNICCVCLLCLMSLLIMLGKIIALWAHYKQLVPRKGNIKNSYKHLYIGYTLKILIHYYLL